VCDINGGHYVNPSETGKAVVPPRHRRITITDVGSAAGVSAATVSRVLNGNARVDPALADRVQRAVADLDYRPNPVAQGLARGRVGSIGVLVPDLANPYFPDILKAVSSVARSHGRRVMIMESNEDPANELEAAEDLLRCCDGVLLCSTRMDRAPLTALALREQPLVLVNRIVPGLAVPSVAVDFYGGMTMVCGHLAQLGHQRVAYLSGPPESWANSERVRAFTAAKAFGLQVTVMACGSTSHDGYRAVPAIAEAGVTAVIAYNDLVALGAMAALEEAGQRVPEDYSVIGCDDISIDHLPNSARLSTASGSREQLGRLATEMLEEAMTHPHDREPEYVPMELLIRGTSARPGPRPPA
jgi:LacI family transcriptional regulator